MRKNIISQYGLQIAKYLFPLITLPYLTRVLGPHQYAVRAYVLAVMNFMLVFLDYGFTLSGTKSIAEKTDDIVELRQYTSAIVILRGLLCIAGAIILFCIMPFMPILKSNTLYVIIAYLGICLKASLPDFVFQGLEDMSIITQRFVGSQTVSTLLIFTLIHKPSDLLLVPVFEGVASLIAFIWSWDNVLRVRSIHFVKVHFSFIWLNFKESTIFFLSNAATTVFNAFTTMMIGIYVADPVQISYWSLAMTAITAVQSLYDPIINTLYPHIVKSHDIKLLKRFLYYGMVVVTIGSVLFALCSKLIMLILGGKQYLSGSYVIAQLTPVLWLSFPGMLIGFPFLAAVGKIKELTCSTIVAALFHMIGLIFLGFSGYFSITAVAVLRSCTEALMLIIRSYFSVLTIRQNSNVNIQ
ncbi:oligosaccharide flippase family protein [Bifidobacterium sp. ESL0764]|uniref:oligosaccharide flippase family protein n=1 Tax=Bifidobacterium sp. ESL0764 TaxID=2983228 RepID=UPI0023F8CD13|nr:oligosaccharide flippase family protein [Bifidobacterium sp. ESL0764]WEV65557.1 oligosaccharide flippase family protein [Bifidobacterium sp. ESL0764]